MSQRKRVQTSQIIIIYVTFKNKKEATFITSALLKKNLIACANEFAPMTSTYKWKGQIKKQREVVVLYKTRTSLEKKVYAEILRLHSYETPCLISLRPENVQKKYQAWLLQETKS